MPDDHRLPRTVLPRRYELRIEPDLDSGSFTGVVAATVDVADTVDEVVLNANALVVESASVDGVDATWSLDPERERLTLRPAGPVGPGEAVVRIAFRGELNDKLKGFYRSTFTDDQGVQRTIATTQMEPTDARMAFPCWDEPDMKAVFGVTLVVADGLFAVSNAAESGRSTLPDGRVEIRFADTIPMSTYLVAFVVGPLEATEPVDVDGVPLRVVHVPGKGHLAPYSLEVGAFCLRLFSEYYGIPYPGDKCDLVALPDFAAGAMENLGCITFREALLLVDPEQSTQAELQRVADVVAHELAHMWFGDLVTMKWWNGLWLNEAFATFMELMAVHAFKPEWQRWVAFTNERAAAFAVDSLESTRPIEYEVRSPEDAEGMFDVLTYQKGGSVLRMLEQYLGEDRFRAGIRLYLQSRQYGNAETTDLWDAIEEATGEPVRRIMDSWIFQGGYPAVSVEVDGDRATFTQRRFRFLDGEGTAEWAVPLLVRVGDGDPQKVLLDTASTTVELAGASKGLVANAGGHGFYRVRYSPALLDSLRSRVFDLAPVERSILLDDAWASVLAGDTPATAFLDLASGFSEETDPAVWATLVPALGALERLLDGDARTAYQQWLQRLARPALQRLGWKPADGEDDLTRQTRQTVLTLLGGIGADPEVRGRAREVHRSYLDDAASVDPNVAAAVVAVLAADGSADDHAAFLDRYRTSTSPQESLRYLYALGQFPGEELATRTLDLALSEFRSQNAPFVVLFLLSNRDTNDLAWEWVKGEWDRINERFPDNTIPRLLGGITTLSKPEQAADVERFLAEHPVPQARKTIEQHLERLRVNVALREREAAAVARHVTS